jgi:SAM-dependent methyltransferase
LASIALNRAGAAAYTIDDQRRMALARNYFAWQGRLVLPEIGQRVLEVGCGVGNFTATLLDREAVFALDKEPACVEALRQRYAAHHNVQAFTCDVADKKTFRAFGRFAPDSCVCLNVLEHIEDDGGLLQSMSDVLAPGGVIVLLVPAFPSLYGPIDRHLGHFRRYTMRSLGETSANIGLSLKKAHYLNAVGFFGWWLNARIFRREVQAESQIEFFDRYIVPLASRVEGGVSPPFGQSIFAVLQKP